jgi:3-oxoacyl-[acyl-carrier-protein] synthase II
MSVEPLTLSETQRERATSAGGALSPVAAGLDLPQAVIVGAGLVTPLGDSTASTWSALLAGRFITDHARAAGEYERSPARVIQMARRAALEALADAKWRDGDDDAESFTTIVGTSKGSIENWLTAPAPLQKHMSRTACEGGGFEAGGRTANLPDVTGLADIATALSGRGPKLTVSAACASGLLALARAVMMVRAGEAKRVLVVAAEASVHPLFLGSFRRLGVLPREEIGCRPFDESRDGFLMSEAAAALCVEALCGPAQESGLPNDAAASPWNVAIDRFAVGGDASHLTATDPDGRLLRHLINKVTPTGGFDLVHAHGTGTVANDPVELAAIEAALADSSPASSPCLYSHKGAIGHSLGAAGLMSVVLSALAHRHGVVPPNVRTTCPLSTTRVQIHAASCRRPIRRSLALAAGFGGATAAVALRSI